MRLLGQEFDGTRILNYWLHTGDDGRDKITVEIKENVDPVFDSVRFRAQSQSSNSTFKYKGSIPFTLIEELCKVNASLWGVSVREAYSEFIQQKTDRSQRLLRMLLQDREYRKLQAGNYA